MELLEKETNVSWEDDKPTEFNDWNVYKDTSYVVYYPHFKQLYYGGMDKYFKNDFEIVEYQDLIKPDRSVNPTYDEKLPLFVNKEPTQDMVESPNHYIGDNGLEVEEVLRNFIPRYEDSYVAHRVASAIEYLLRSPLKNGVQDIEKASYNLTQALEHLREIKEK